MSIVIFMSAASVMAAVSETIQAQQQRRAEKAKHRRAAVHLEPCGKTSFHYNI